MVKIKQITCLLFIGSLWGLNEMITGDFLYSKDIPLASVWLSSIALFLLSAGRAIAHWPGSSATISVIASLFRLVNAGPYLCHLLGILMLGLAFEAVVSLLSGFRTKKATRLSLIGILSAYGSHILFALVITYAIRYAYWVSGGLTKVLDHIFVSGSFLAMLAVFLVPLGFYLGKKSETLFLRQLRLSLTGIFILTLLFWLTGRFVG